MILTNKQEEGLKIAVTRYKAREPYTCISGYAGTGKSTLVKFIIAALNIPMENVAYVAFTGKAASVLRHKGCPNASTAHKLLYYSSKTVDGKFIFKPRKTLEGDYKLIVVDEVSMLPKELWDLLLSHKRHIIALGDPFQIPPINKNSDNGILQFPHIFLDEIMRQAQESEIIRLTMDIRNHKPIKYFKGNEVQVVREEETVDGMYHWADQIICATNKKRQEINNFMRAAAGRGEEPEPGDKVIALVNRWDISDFSGENALVNGAIGTLGEFIQKDIHFPYWLRVPATPVLASEFITQEDGYFDELIIDYKALVSGEYGLTPQQSYKVWKCQDSRPLLPIEFNYGYAITGHKAQGSQWDKVLVYEESFPFEREEHARWVYTSCTRAAEKLVLVR